MHPEHRLHRRARGGVAVHEVHRLGNHRDGGDLAHRVGRGQQPVAKPPLCTEAFLELDRLGAQHHVREVDVPRVRRDVRALGHVAQVAQIALVDHLPEVLLLDAVDFHGRRGVHQVEQRRKGGAQADAAAAAVADVEHALQLLLDFRLVPEVGVLPVERVAGRCFERAFAHVGGQDPDSNQTPRAGRPSGADCGDARPKRPVRTVDPGELPVVSHRRVAQQEAATIVGLDLEVAVRGVVPSVEDRDHRESARAEVEDMGLGLAAPAGTSVDADLHDANFLSTGSCKEPATRHAPLGGCAPYLAIVLVSTLATFSPGTEC